MSKLEVLHQCPQCGQTGFSKPGLTAHLKSKTCTRRQDQLAKSEPDKPVMLKEFDGIRLRVKTIQDLGRRASHESILLGHDLNLLKKQIGTKKGGDQKSEKSKLQSATLIPWKELVEQQTGLSYDTCHRCMQLADGAKKHIPILTASDVLQKPLSALPEARQGEVVKALEKAADGQSMNQLMHSFGVWKDKAHKSPPKATKESAANRNANASNQALTAEQLMAQAKEDIGTMHDIHIGEAWKTLDTEDLADLENKLVAYHEAVAAELKARKGKVK